MVAADDYTCSARSGSHSLRNYTLSSDVDLKISAVNNVQLQFAMNSTGLRRAVIALPVAWTGAWLTYYGK
jgi:hypothetical protein